MSIVPPEYADLVRALRRAAKTHRDAAEELEVAAAVIADGHGPAAADALAESDRAMRVMEALQRLTRGDNSFRH